MWFTGICCVNFLFWIFCLARGQIQVLLICLGPITFTNIVTMTKPKAPLVLSVCFAVLGLLFGILGLWLWDVRRGITGVGHLLDLIGYALSAAMLAAALAVIVAKSRNGGG